MIVLRKEGGGERDRLDAGARGRGAAEYRVSI